MKFEQLLQVYWSKGFLYGGKVQKFDSNLLEFYEDKPGMSKLTQKLFVMRFELNRFVFKKDKSFITLDLDSRKIINMFLSRLISINNNIFELTRYNLIRLYLIKTFRGRTQALGKPSRGQRTWSNANTAYKYNKIIRFFIYQVKKNNVIEKKKETLNVKFLKKKTKKSAPKIKMVFFKKKKNLWF